MRWHSQWVALAGWHCLQVKLFDVVHITVLVG